MWTGIERQILIALIDALLSRIRLLGLKIEIDQPVMVFIKALNQTVPGRVSGISPVADTLGGDVVYKTIIELDEPLPGLRAGMSAEVQFEAGG